MKEQINEVRKGLKCHKNKMEEIAEFLIEWKSQDEFDKWNNTLRKAVIDKIEDEGFIFCCCSNPTLVLLQHMFYADYVKAEKREDGLIWYKINKKEFLNRV